jgi:hypothetical protein
VPAVNHACGCVTSPAVVPSAEAYGPGMEPTVFIVLSLILLIAGIGVSFGGREQHHH